MASPAPPVLPSAVPTAPEAMNRSQSPGTWVDSREATESDGTRALDNGGQALCAAESEGSLGPGWGAALAGREEGEEELEQRCRAMQRPRCRSVPRGTEGATVAAADSCRKPVWPRFPLMSPRR